MSLEEGGPRVVAPRTQFSLKPKPQLQPGFANRRGGWYCFLWLVVPMLLLLIPLLSHGPRSSTPDRLHGLDLWMREVEARIKSASSLSTSLASAPVAQSHLKISDIASDSLVPVGASAIKIRLIALWVGDRLSSTKFERYAWYAAGCSDRTKSIVDEHEKDDRVDVLAVVDEAYNASFVASAACPRLTIHRVQNLSDFLHDGIDRHIPGAAGHARFTFGRKACDLRWMFGELFQEQLKGYSWWGWLDAHSFVNGILGPTTRYGQVLLESDVVTWNIVRSNSTMRNHLSVRGLMALVSNTPKMNRLYLGIPDIARLLTSPKLMAVDELAGALHVLTQPGITVSWVDYLYILEPLKRKTFYKIVRDNGQHYSIPLRNEDVQKFAKYRERNSSELVNVSHLRFMFDMQRSPRRPRELPNAPVDIPAPADESYPEFGILTKNGEHEWHFRCHAPDMFKTMAGNVTGIVAALSTCRNGGCMRDVQRILS